MANKENTRSKGYIFISHSHKDSEIVKKIRNQFEENNIEPILFYLRCMEDPDSNDAKQLEELIHKEIDARDYFIYAKSKNSETSPWVQNELKYIKSTRPSVIKTLDIDQNYETIKYNVDKIISKRTILIIYANKDQHLKDEIADHLSEQDYTLLPSNPILSNNTSWNKSIINYFNNIPSKTTVLILCTDNYLQSKFSLLETEHFLLNTTNKCIPIFFNNTINKYKNTFFIHNYLISLDGIVMDMPIKSKELYSLTAALNNNKHKNSWGPERKTFTMSKKPDYAVFNSICDNPIIGNEKYFVRIKEENSDVYETSIKVIPGHAYEISIYYHNNSSDKVYNKAIGIADWVEVFCDFPSIINSENEYDICARITSCDCMPKEVWSSCKIKSDENCLLQYVENTAIIHNKGKLNNESIGPAYLFGSGALLGYNKFSGLLPGGIPYSGNITFKIFVKKI